MSDNRANDALDTTNWNAIPRVTGCGTHETWQRDCDECYDALVECADGLIDMAADELVAAEKSASTPELAAPLIVPNSALEALVAKLMKLTDGWGTASSSVVASAMLGVRSVALEIAALAGPAGECTCAEHGCDMAGDCGGSCGCNESAHAGPVATEQIVCGECNGSWVHFDWCSKSEPTTTTDVAAGQSAAGEPVCDPSERCCYLYEGVECDLRRDTHDDIGHEFQPAESGGASK